MSTIMRHKGNRQVSIYIRSFADSLVSDWKGNIALWPIANRSAAQIHGFVVRRYPIKPCQHVGRIYNSSLSGLILLWQSCVNLFKLSLKAVVLSASCVRALQNYLDKNNPSSRTSLALCPVF